MLATLPHFSGADLLVGHGTADDAAVLRIDGTRAIVQTVDFFTPIVDDPTLFGEIAAANSISDIYAMGATPILGLAIAGFPTEVLPLSMLEEILQGGVRKASEAGFPVAGGHTIIDDVPKYGLAVTGMVDLAHIVRNSTARPGDLLYLTKPIGNGILVSAFRALTGGGWRRAVRRDDAPDLSEAIGWMTTLNRDGAKAMVAAGASAATDVTGYGLIGHLLEMCNGAGVGARLEAGAVPVLSGAREYLARGYVPEGTLRNERTFRPSVDLKADDATFRLLCDAQTSGGLLVTIDPAGSETFERLCREDGVLFAKIGLMNDRAGTIEIAG